MSHGSWLERNRRPLIVAYLTALGLVCLAVLLPPLRAAMTGSVEHLVDLRVEGWQERIREAEALVAEDRFAEAEPLLEELDRRFPARTRLHALDRDRERILHALGAAYRGLDRKALALDAFHRAVLFDPLNVGSRFDLASAALAFEEPDEAAAQLDSIIAIYPPHAGATRELIALRFEDSDYEGVAAAFERYLTAFRVHAFLATVGDERRILRLPADGRAHQIELRVPRGTTEIVLDAPRATVEIGAVAWRGLARAGETERRSGAAAPLAIASSADDVRFALGPDAASAHLTITARIPLDSATWERVETSYRNLLRSDALALLRARLAVLPESEWDAVRTESP